jgi:hypothetical protein
VLDVENMNEPNHAGVLELVRMWIVRDSPTFGGRQQVQGGREDACGRVYSRLGPQQIPVRVRVRVRAVCVVWVGGMRRDECD